jgi:hypothetical protein
MPSITSERPVPASSSSPSVLFDAVTESGLPSERLCGILSAASCPISADKRLVVGRVGLEPTTQGL